MLDWLNVNVMEIAYDILKSGPKRSWFAGVISEICPLCESEAHKNVSKNMPQICLNYSRDVKMIFKL